MSISNYKSVTIGEANLHSLRATSIEADLMEAVALRIGGEDFDLAGVVGLNTDLGGRGGFPDSTVVANLRRQGSMCLIEVMSQSVAIAGPVNGYFGVEFPAGLLVSLGMSCSANRAGHGYVEIDHTSINDHVYLSFSAAGEQILILNPVVAGFQFAVGVYYYGTPFFISYVANA